MSAASSGPLRLDEDECRLLLAAHPQWQRAKDREAIRRYLRFDSFAEAFGFMSAVAIIAEKLGHHPEWLNACDRVEIWLSTHEVRGLSNRDARLAERIDELALLFGDSRSRNAVKPAAYWTYLDVSRASIGAEEDSK